MQILMLLLLGAYVALQVADGVTTYKSLNAPSGLLYEANPLARWAFKHFGLVAPIAAFKGLGVAIGVALALHPSLLTYGALSVLAAVGVVVFRNNLRMLNESD